MRKLAMLCVLLAACESATAPAEIQEVKGSWVDLRVGRSLQCRFPVPARAYASGSVVLRMTTPLDVPGGTMTTTQTWILRPAELVEITASGFYVWSQPQGFLLNLTLDGETFRFRCVEK